MVTKLRLRIEPTFNLDVEITYHSDLALGLEDGPLDLVRKCDYGQLNWFPGQRRVVKTCGIKTDLPRQTGATNRLLQPDFSEWISGPAERALQHGSCRTSFNCVIERVRYRQFLNTPHIYRKMEPNAPDRSFHNVVGAGNRMMSSEFTEVQDGVMQYDFEFAIPAQKAAAAFAAARKHFDAEDLCFPLVGIFIRFSRVDDEAWLAHTSTSDEFHTGDVAVFMEMPIYIPAGFTPERTEAHLRPYKAWVKRLITEFGARPHWGKNDTWVFDLQDPDRAYGARWDVFRSTIATLDPGGLFMNSWLKERGFGREKDATR
ncbi:D-arabinono-1,4-lactone oxidase [Nannocystis pusilla]|uniref:D-arabinono-1,4-lactone oxidase n=1 Tax=Nannocystis pusilla TaxID=889268 RepID=UPI003B762E2B